MQLSIPHWVLNCIDYFNRGHVDITIAKEPVEIYSFKQLTDLAKHHVRSKYSGYKFLGIDYIDKGRLICHISHVDMEQSKHGYGCSEIKVEKIIIEL